MGTWDNIDVDFDADIEDRIKHILDEFGCEIAKTADKLFKEKAQELLGLLIERSPYSTMDMEVKHYRDGWTVSTERFGEDKIYVISNKNKPTLTHILEHGVVNLYTGELVGRLPHINNSYQEVEGRLLDELLNLIIGRF